MTKEKPYFVRFDARMVELIREGKNSFGALSVDKELAALVRESGAQYYPNEEWRVVDRRLQALRRKGVIRSVKGTIGPVWEVV